MGAAAIAALAVVQLVPAVRAYPGLTGAAGFVVGLGVLFWSVASWWLPLLVIVMIWRHAIGGVPLTYRFEHWSMVFLLGMYTVATLGFAQLVGITALFFIPRICLWIAVLAWCVVFFGMMRDLTRNLRLSVADAGGGNPEWYQGMVRPAGAWCAPAARLGYSPGVAAGCCCARCGGLPARTSSSHRLWCSLAQLTSTVPVPIASNAPSMPIVPI